MKRLTLLFTLTIMITGLMAQTRGVAPLARGEKQINFGAGVYSKGIPAYFSVDFALHKDVTLTPEVHAVFPFPGEKFKGGVMMKGDYHWNYLIGIPANWDFYAGARVGVSFGGSIYPDFGIQVGGRWYWSNIWGMNLELAGGTGFGATFGLSVKL